MNKPLFLILPLPPKVETDKFCIPYGLFPDGVKDLAICALENKDNMDAFLEDTLTLIDGYVDYLTDEKQIEYYAQWFKNESYALFLEVSLQSFFLRFLEIVAGIAGKHFSVSLVRVVSYQPIGGICVEVNHEHAPIPYCRSS
jgi:hypothetical protein